MIVIAVGDEDKVNGWKLVERDAGSLQAGDKKRDSVRIDGICKNVTAVNLDQNRCMIDERNRTSHWAVGFDEQGN